MTSALTVSTKTWLHPNLWAVFLHIQEINLMYSSVQFIFKLFLLFKLTFALQRDTSSPLLSVSKAGTDSHWAIRVSEMAFHKLLKNNHFIHLLNWIVFPSSSLTKKGSLRAFLRACLLWMVCSPVIKSGQCWSTPSYLWMCWERW